MKESGDSVDARASTPPSEAVVEAVATAEGIALEELCPPEYDPLHAAIDPEALDALFAPRRRGVSQREGTVTFSYCGYEITITSDGTVQLD